SVELLGRKAQPSNPLGHLFVLRRVGRQQIHRLAPQRSRERAVDVLLLLGAGGKRLQARTMHQQAAARALQRLRMQEVSTLLATTVHHACQLIGRFWAYCCSVEANAPGRQPKSRTNGSISTELSSWLM